ncbi:Crp/Fnr family transcriptional regulator [Aquimarina sp. AD10]|uniref:Crp/Fnr family transcriptional regulator n=1 Tax=Aquimarina sp. AD10 TaxID=1714849 RepID=UPI000E4CF408|nr:Crp/Fnr family transcriptional regulator [Aquimarina sp. AD10]AXT59784.1 Crp/Fnr family transcriptional regulator [Aquimarina sp. AD10]RKM97654.1 Crp/Fnr family transcriptional regulator [Aquimarina sp. AD10]
MSLELFNILIKSKEYRRSYYCEKEIITASEYYDKKIYLIENGIVKISRLTEQGEEMILVILTSGQVFGANLILEEFHPNYICESLNSETVLCEFDIECVKRVIEKDQHTEFDLLSIIGKQFSEMERRIKVLCNNSAEQRLVDVLKEFKDKFDHLSDNEENIIIDMPLNQDEISNYIRTTRVTTNKLINKLKNNLLIEYQQKNIMLKKDFFKHYK